MTDKSIEDGFFVLRGSKLFNKNLTGTVKFGIIDEIKQIRSLK